MEQQTISQEEAAKKTKELGVKIYSTEEITANQFESAKRNTEAFKFFLGEIIKADGLLIIDQLTEVELEKAFKDPINNTYEFVRENGGTINDLEKIMKNIQMLSYLFERAKNTAGLLEGKVMFTLLGENSINDVPLKKLEGIVVMGSEEEK
jgi:hypothetical protein